MSQPARYNQSKIAVLDRSISPHEKALYVRAMFDDIAGRYDFLNTLLSAGIHHHWRGFATRCAALGEGDAALDVCTGTGDWAVLLRRAVGASGRVVGLDFSHRMMCEGEAKFVDAGVARIEGDATRLPFASGRFQAVTVAFGIRNVADIPAAFSEMARVLAPGGRVVVLEFARPHDGIFRGLYDGYSRHVMPRVGGAVSGRPDAYAYLPASVEQFHSRGALAELMEAAGLVDVRYVDITCGLVCVHVGVKPAGRAVEGERP
ncbi:MAG: bifunctional demethylmenaquinone methyltransferase/2-methoxy-6-polyprenyl-1,4-benzoquinol methylase UbiE [Capsulimonadaceae bacterium]